MTHAPGDREFPTGFEPPASQYGSPCRYAIGLPLLVWALLGASQLALAQVPGLEFRDIREIRSSAIATRPAVGTPPIVWEQQSSPGNARGPGDASLGPPIARLGLDARGLLAATAMPVGEMSQSGSPLVDFAIGDYVLRMAIIERVVDRDFDALHFTLVDPDTPDYARLTIANNGPELIGTVFRGREEYRIVPEADRHQIVYPVVRYRAEFRRAGGPQLETRAGRLEARHLQMAWFAERRPERFWTAADGRLTAFESGPTGMPALGRIDIFAAMQPDADGKPATDATRLSKAVETFLDDIRHLTLLDDSVQVTTGLYDLNRIYEGRANQAEFGFRQLIDGISVGADTDLEIDRTGNVLGFTGRLMHPSTAERGRNVVSEQLAHSTSIAAFRERVGVDWPLEVRDSELRYEPSSDETGLNLIWRIVLRSGGCSQNFYVDVRALTGDIEAIGWAPGETRRSGGDVLAELRSMCP